jgi:uncharacterized protein YpiB (UPF0302 family)
MKENSYTELLKSRSMNKRKQKEHYVLNLYIEMLLSEILLKAEKERLSIQIDQAIDRQDKVSFNQLSKQYKEICSRFGN